jgi:MFS family permease
MPAIAKDVGFAVAGAAWVIDAYSLAFTGALLASGALADRFGPPRRAMLAGQCRVSHGFNRLWLGDQRPAASDCAGRAGRFCLADCSSSRRTRIQVIDSA